MKPILVAITAFAFQASAVSETIVIDGKKYEQVQWGNVTQTTVSITHKNGIGKIPLSKLPPELQRRFGYDPSKAPPETPAPPIAQHNSNALTAESSATHPEASKAEQSGPAGNSLEHEPTLPKGTATRKTPDQITPDIIFNEFKRAVDKLQEIAKPGPTSIFIKEFIRKLDMYIQSGSDAKFQVGCDLTRDNKAYEIDWISNRFSCKRLNKAISSQTGWLKMDLLSDKVLKLGASANQIKVNVLTSEKAFALGFQYFILDLVLGEPMGTMRVGKELAGRVRLACSSSETREVTVILQWSSGNTRYQKAAHPTVSGGKESTDLNFSFPEVTEDEFRPVFDSKDEISGVLMLVTRIPKLGEPARPIETLSNSVSVRLHASH